MAIFGNSLFEHPQPGQEAEILKIIKLVKSGAITTKQATEKIAGLRRNK